MAELPVPTLNAEHVGEIAGLPITNSILGTWIALALALAFVFVASRRAQLVPAGSQNVLELVVERFRGLVSDVLDGNQKLTDRYLPLVIAVFLFVLFVNLVGLIPGFGTVGGTPTHGAHSGEFVPLLRSGSSDLNLTLAIASVSFLAAQLTGIFTVGFWRYGGKFINFKTLFQRPFKLRNILLFIPTFFLGLIELISELAKLISLSFRLFGNVYAGEVLLVVFGFLLPVFVPLSGPFYLLEVFVGLIQAFVFAMLTIVFIKIATIEPH